MPKVFIVGCQRSGTTTALQSLSGILECRFDTEGFVFDTVAHLSRAIEGMRLSVSSEADDVSTFSLFQISADDLLRDYTRTLAAALSTRFGTDSWADKTPGPRMIEALPHIASALPDARVVFMHRHPISCVRSLCQRFPTKSFRAHVDHWHQTNQTWLRKREFIPHRIEVSQSQLLNEPRRVATELAAFFEMGDAKAKALSEMLTVTHAERNSLATAGNSEDLLAIASDTDRDYLFHRCGEIAAKLGYTFKTSGICTGEGSSLLPDSGRLYLYFPVGSLGSDATVEHINSYCYRRDSHSFQIAPNPNGDPIFTLAFNHMYFGRPCRLIAMISHEFPDGPTVEFSVAVLTKQREIAQSRRISIVATEEHALDMSLPEGTEFSLQIQCRLGRNESSTDFSTLFIKHLAIEEIGTSRNRVGNG